MDPETGSRTFRLSVLRDGAARGIRTPDPVITNDVLYQLSYCGELSGFGRRPDIARPPILQAANTLRLTSPNARKSRESRRLVRRGRFGRRIRPLPGRP